MVDFKLYLITNRMFCRPATLEETIAEACQAGVRAVQLREKDLSGKALHTSALKLREVTRSTGTKLFINDRVDIALAAGTEGIHCPENGIPPSIARRLFPEGLIGASVHSLERAVDARTRGADFILFGPIFPTPSKVKFGDPQGLKALAYVSGNAGGPVFAVGGITPENAQLCMENGAVGVGVVSAIMSATDITKTVSAFEYALGGL